MHFWWIFPTCSVRELSELSYSAAFVTKRIPAHCTFSRLLHHWLESDRKCDCRKKALPWRKKHNAGTTRCRVPRGILVKRVVEPTWSETGAFGREQGEISRLNRKPDLDFLKRGTFSGEIPVRLGLWRGRSGAEKGDLTDTTVFAKYQDEFAPENELRANVTSEFKNPKGKRSRRRDEAVLSWLERSSSSETILSFAFQNFIS